MKNNLIDELYYKAQWIKSSTNFLFKTRKLKANDDEYMEAIEKYMASLDDDIHYHLDKSSKTVVTEPKDFQNGFDHFLQMRDLIEWNLGSYNAKKPIEVVKSMYSKDN